MNILSYILIAVSAVISGVVVFILTKHLSKKEESVSSAQDNIVTNSPLPEDNAKVIELEKKLQKTLQSKSDLENELHVVRDENAKVIELEKKLQKTLQSKSDLENELHVVRGELANAQQQLSDLLKGQISAEEVKSFADSSILNEKIAKLEKKIKDFDDEIEDYEDEIDKLKKDLKKKRDESMELEDQLRDSKKINSELEEKVISVSSSLENTQKVLSIKEESLSFVQEVLQAQKASDGKELETAIDRIVDFFHEELSDVIKETSNLQIDETSLMAWSLSAKKSWLKNKTTIAFVGEFSAGKTSIVNRILSQDDNKIPLLPVSAKATTAIPTYISGGLVTAYQFYSPDNILKTISETTFKKVSKEVLQQVEGLSSLITYFVMKYKNPNLDKLSILDTPGFNSNDSEDARRTIDVINECDALFWVFDVNVGTINRSSLKTIKENLTKPLFVVINKVDTKSDKEVADVERLIKKTLETEQISVEGYIRFSSNPKYDLKAIMNPIISITRDTSRDEFLEEWKNSLTILQSELKNEMENATQSFNELRKKHENVVEQYVNAQNQLYRSCERAVQIPQYRSGFLGIGEGYKMNSQEYDKLVNILEDIATAKQNRLANLFDESNSIVDEVNDSYNIKADWELSLRKVTSIIDKFNKLDSAYKKASMLKTNSK